MVHYIHPNILLRSIQGMNSEVRLDEFRLKTGIEKYICIQTIITFFSSKKNRNIIR